MHLRIVEDVNIVIICIHLSVIFNYADIQFQSAVHATSAADRIVV